MKLPNSPALGGKWGLAPMVVLGCGVLLWVWVSFLAWPLTLEVVYSANLTSSEVRSVDGYKTWQVSSRQDGHIESITEENLASIIRDASNDWGELIFTTFGLPGNGTGHVPSHNDYTYGSPAFTFNWVSKLRRAGVLNFLVIGTSTEACQDIARIDIPCFVNTLAWGVDIQERHWTPGFFVRLKWYYLMRIASLGYHPIFMDNDAMVAQSPFAHWDRSLDFQGLADGTDGSGRGELPERSNGMRCPLKDSRYGGFDYPCMSTGVMLCRSTPATKAFLESFVAYIESHWFEWEQAIFQKHVMSFLIRMGTGPPALHLGILPVDRWHNVGDLHARKAKNLPTESVVVHCGYIYGGVEKSKALVSVGLWQETPHPAIS